MKLRAGDYERDSSGLLIPRRRGIEKAHPQFMCGPAFFGGSSGDPYFSSVGLLLHGDGTNGSTTLTDSSSSPKTAVIGGATALNTTSPKFGTASIGLTGAGADYFQYASSVLAFGTADFTLEFWTYSTTFASNPALVDNRVVTPSASLVIYMLSTNGIWHFFANGADQAVSSATSISVWNHLAWSKNSNVSRFFLNGTQQGSNYTDTNNYNHTTLRFGNNSSGSNSLSGRFDDIRVTLGVGRYTSNFSVPTAAFPNS